MIWTLSPVNRIRDILQKEISRNGSGRERKFPDVSRELEFAGELYDEKICRRVEQVVFEQMRKYRLYFREKIF